MHHRRRHNQHMKNTMRAPPDIKPPRPQTLWVASRIEESPKRDQPALSQIIGESRGGPHARAAVDGKAVEDGDEAAETHGQEGADAQAPVPVALEVFRVDYEDRG